ncbi:MAG: hypothetical protein IKE55_12990 [Kiritimatiellae bacterium]|nr:hypothetical protein [Kiritimatiellia bacterium]
MATYNGLAAGLPSHERADVRELAGNVLFMRRKLRETRILLKEQPLVIPYDNGGGQEGVRANPAYKEYENLLKSYTAALAELRSILADVEKTEQRPGGVATILDRSRFANRKAANG